MINEKQQLISDFKRYLMQIKNSSSYISCDTIMKKSAQAPSPNLVLPEKELFVPAVPPPNSSPKMEKPVTLPVAPIQQQSYSKTIAQPSIDHFTDIRAIMKKVAPSVKIAEEPLPDAKAAEIKNEWNIKLEVPSTPILVCGESKEAQAFLQQVAKAIETTFGSSKSLLIAQIEKKMKLEEFLDKNQIRLIILSKQTLHSVKTILVRYKETGPLKATFINDIPAIILDDVTKYFTTPSEKKKLWHEICRHLAVKK